MISANVVTPRQISEIEILIEHLLHTSILSLIGTEPTGKSCTMTVRVFVDLRGIGRERELYGSKVTDSVLQFVQVTWDRNNPNALSTSSLCVCEGRWGVKNEEKVRNNIKKRVKRMKGKI